MEKQPCMLVLKQQLALLGVCITVCTFTTWPTPYVLQIVHFNDQVRSFFFYGDWISDKRRRVELVEGTVGENNTYKVGCQYVDMLFDETLLVGVIEPEPSLSVQKLGRAWRDMARVVGWQQTCMDGMICMRAWRAVHTDALPWSAALGRLSSRPATSVAQAQMPTSPLPCLERRTARWAVLRVCQSLIAHGLRHRALHNPHRACV